MHEGCAVFLHVTIEPTGETFPYFMQEDSANIKSILYVPSNAMPFKLNCIVIMTEHIKI